MKQYILITLCCLSLVSCETETLNTTQQFEGDYYVTLINFYNPNIFGHKKEEIKNAILNTNSKEDKTPEVTNYFKTLIENDLFDKQNFQLKVSNGDIINVFIDDDKCDKLKDAIRDLDRSEEKVTVKFEGYKISNGMYNRAIYSANKITYINKTKGKTDWNK